MKMAYVVFGCIIVVILVVLALFAVTPPPPDPAKALYDQGKDLSAKGEYAAAIEKYYALTQQYPSSEYADPSRVDKLVAECYVSWAQALESEQKYDEAVEKYELALNTSRSWVSTETTEGLGNCYYEWAQTLRSQHNYAEAIYKYNSTPYGYQKRDAAKQAIDDCIKEWIPHLVTTKQYDEAVETYFIILNNYSGLIPTVWDWVGSDTAEALKDVPADVQFTWATKLQQEKSYHDAIRLYKTIIEYNPGTNYASEAEKAQVNAEIAQIAEGNHGSLPPPSTSTPQQLEGKVEYKIKNDTPYPLTVLLSGPTVKSAILSPYGSTTVTLEPGNYKVAAKADTTGSSNIVTPYYGENALSGDTQYESKFYISYG